MRLGPPTGTGSAESHGGAAQSGRPQLTVDEPQGVRQDSASDFFGLLSVVFGHTMTE
jgi:hypothetical protein